MLLGNAPHPYQLCLSRLSLFKMSFVLRAKLSICCTCFTLELIGLDQWFRTGFALGHRLYIGYEVVIVFHTKSVGIKDKYVKWKIYFWITFKFREHYYWKDEHVILCMTSQLHVVYTEMITLLFSKTCTFKPVFKVLRLQATKTLLYK